MDPLMLDVLIVIGSTILAIVGVIGLSAGLSYLVHRGVIWSDRRWNKRVRHPNLAEVSQGAAEDACEEVLLGHHDLYWWTDAPKLIGESQGNEEPEIPHLPDRPKVNVAQLQKSIQQLQELHRALKGALVPLSKALCTCYVHDGHGMCACCHRQYVNGVRHFHPVEVSLQSGLGPP